MDLRKCLLTKNACYKAGERITPIGVMWHSTGANNPNLKRYVQPDDGKLGVNPNGNDWNRPNPGGRSVCVHAFIGKDKNGVVCTYQTLPWDYLGWHCGGAGNSRYISFEICEDALNDRSYFNAVYKEAVEFTAYLCKLHGFNPKGKNVIICHQDGYRLGIASNHSDVYHWFNKFGKTMDDVRNDVAKAMGGDFEVSTGGSSSSGSSSSSGYSGNSIVDYLNSIGKDSSFSARKQYAAQYGISNYTGTAAQNLELLEKMRGGAAPSKPSTSGGSSASYYKAFNSTSIVDGLKSIGVDSSFDNRKKIAAANGISNYEGTASQNSKLCSLAKSGKLKKAGSSSGSASSASYYKAFSGVSIVDGLKSIGVDSSMATRKRIAKANGISNYAGTAAQNTELLALAKKGKLKKP